MSGHPHNFRDRTGMTYGYLTVTEYAGNGRWRCVCACGNERFVKSYALDSGQHKSCGCMASKLRNESMSCQGLSGERLHAVWQSMIQRCYNERNNRYSYYGARGIRVCEEWRNDYMAFREWALETGYDETAKRGQCTIDRIDTDGNYEPANCRWADSSTQSKNRRPFKQGYRTLAVEQIDENENVIGRYDSMKEAVKASGVNRGGISNVCRGICKTTGGGTRWRYADQEVRERYCRA